MLIREFVHENANENDSHYKPHLYLDMDGVQCDFFKAWSEFEGVEGYKDIPRPEQSIKRLADSGPEAVYEFFRDLETLRGGLRVIDWLQEHDIPYTILSAPLRYERQASIMGKREWLDKHHVGASESAIFASDKSKYAIDSQGRPNVLIDDFGKNTVPWDEAGGIAIKHDPFDEGPTITALEKIYLKDEIDEASPDTLEGSFTPDLQYSKVWLLDEVQKILGKTQLDTIYNLGSWYSNMGLFLVANKLGFNKLINVDIDKDTLSTGEKLLDKLGISDKVEHMHKDANTIDYRQLKSPGLVINTSTNDIDGDDWLKNIPAGTLVAMQGRHGTLEKFDKQFPLRKTYFLDEVELKDPETDYERFMKIGVK
jgi:5'-nucleotidase